MRTPKVKTNIDQFFSEKLKEYVKCSVCMSFPNRISCNCSICCCTLICNASKQQSSKSGCSPESEDKSKLQESDGFSSYSEATENKSSEIFQFHTSDDFKKSSGRKDCDVFCDEKLNADHSLFSKVLQLEGHGESDGDEAAGNGSEFSYTLDSRPSSVSEGRESSPENCAQYDNIVETFKNAGISKTLSESTVTSEWCITRENSFIVGDILQVQCLCWEKNGYCWIRLTENLTLYQRLQDFLNQNQQNYPVVKPNVNELFLTKHEGIWYRGKIISCNPKTVRCIDTGVRFSPDSMECKELDPEIAELEGLAIQVVVSEQSTPEETVCGLMDIQIVGIKTRGMYEVKILEGIKPFGMEKTAYSKFIKKTESSRRNVLDDLKEGMSGLFTSKSVINTQMVGCLVPDDIEDAVVSFRHVRHLSCMEDQEDEAEVGDFVLVADKKMTGSRGIVKSKSSEYGYEVDLVDMGFVLFSKRIFKMPALTADLLDLAVKITVTLKTPNSLSLFPECNYYFEVKEKLNAGRWLCLLKKNYESEEFPAEGILEKIDKALPRITYIPLKSGCKVVISTLSQNDSGTVVYVRRVDGDYDKKFHAMDKAVKNLPENTDNSFWDNVDIGDLVAAKFTDGSYYRASVTFRKDKRVGVLFYDFGNEQFGKIKELKPLSYNLIREPAYARRITLVGSKNSLSEEGLHYLEILMKQSEKLILQYTDEISDGVVLVEKGGQEINEILLGNVATNQDKYIDLFTENFFRQCMFSVGLVRNFVILYIDEEEFAEMGVFWAANPNNSTLNSALQETNTKVGEHCRSHKREYSPRKGELCLGLFEGDWYRAFATEAHGRDFEIFFVDYGNTSFLQPGSIRKMEREFFRLPPLAMRCILEGFDRLENSDVKVAYTYLSDKINHYVDLAEITEVNDEGSIVYIPELFDKISGTIGD